MANNYPLGTYNTKGDAFLKNSWERLITPIPANYGRGGVGARYIAPTVAPVSTVGIANFAGYDFNNLGIGGNPIRPPMDTPNNFMPPHPTNNDAWLSSYLQRGGKGNPINYQNPTSSSVPRPTVTQKPVGINGGTIEPMSISSLGEDTGAAPGYGTEYAPVASTGYGDFLPGEDPSVIDPFAPTYTNFSNIGNSSVNSGMDMGANGGGVFNSGFQPLGNVEVDSRSPLDALSSNYGQTGLGSEQANLNGLTLDFGGQSTSMPKGYFTGADGKVQYDQNNWTGKDMFSAGLGGLQALSGLSNMYFGYKQMKLSEQTAKDNKFFATANLMNQANLVQDDLTARNANRALSGNATPQNFDLIGANKRTK